MTNGTPGAAPARPAREPGTPADATTSIRLFLRQLSWELRKPWARPRTYLGFAVCLGFELGLLLLWRLPAVREVMARRFWRMRMDLGDILTGPTAAVHLTGETMALIGSLFLGLAAADIVAKEFEDGTMRMVFSRPVARGAVLAQKLVACAVYTAALSVFVAASALALGLLFEGRGRLTVVFVRESVLGSLDFRLGLERYALAIPLMAAAAFTATLLAVCLSCFKIKPGTAIVIGATIIIADHLIRLEPSLASVSLCLTTRFLTWRQLFNQEIPWLRIQRNYLDLLRVDLVLILVSWWAFRRREITP